MGDYSESSKLKDKLNNQSLRLANISHDELLIATGLNSVNVTDKERTINGQATDKERTSITDKETEQTHVQQGLQPDQSTCTPKYVNKLISKHVSKCSNNSIYNSNNKEVLQLSKKPQNQTNEEWLNEYDNAGEL